MIVRSYCYVTQYSVKNDKKPCKIMQKRRIDALLSPKLGWGEAEETQSVY